MSDYLLIYLCFLALTYFVYTVVPAKSRIYILLTASVIFVASLSFKLALFGLLFTTVNYYFGILLYKYHKNEATASKIYWVILLIDIGILAFFKYAHLFTNSINVLITAVGISEKISNDSILIPLGLSYYTFQTLGYIIRIKRGSEKAEENFAAFATLLLFFPKLIAGPVERSNHFLPQLNNLHGANKSDFYAGGSLFLWGLFKKTVIADQLYQPLTEVYGNIHAYSGTSLIVLVLFQTIYIYADFSGYTDMALGSARIFGIKLIDNFNRPFLARSIGEYWKRWHISLSSWCNDFIYNPLIVRYRKFGTRAAIPVLFLTFFIMGIWHGSNVNFVVLGLLQGAAITFEMYTRRFRVRFSKRYPVSLVNTLSRILVFLFMSFSMIFFFAGSISDAWYFFTHLATPNRISMDQFQFIGNKPAFMLALVCFIVLFIAEILIEKGKNPMVLFQRQNRMIRLAGYSLLLLLILFSGAGFSGFYYARF